MEGASQPGRQKAGACQPGESHPIKLFHTRYSEGGPMDEFALKLEDGGGTAASVAVTFAPLAAV